MTSDRPFVFSVHLRCLQPPTHANMYFTWAQERYGEGGRSGTEREMLSGGNEGSDHSDTCQRKTSRVGVELEPGRE